MFGRTHTDRRGQAHTLEGVVGGLLILIAVLFALEAIIITPTTSGAVDPGVREELRDQGDDILAITAENETLGLSQMVRYWDQSDRTFAGEAAVNPRIGYGANHPPGAFGEMLNQTFTSRSRQYNVELRYQGKNVTDERGRLRMVYRGEPSEGAVVASHRVTLYDNQSLSGPYAENAELWEYSTNATNNEDGYYPIPNAIDGPVYNVVEVRVIVW